MPGDYRPIGQAARKSALEALTAPSLDGIKLPATKGLFRIRPTWHGFDSQIPKRRNVAFAQLLPLLEQQRTMFFSL